MPQAITCPIHQINSTMDVWREYVQKLTDAFITRNVKQPEHINDMCPRCLWDYFSSHQQRFPHCDSRVLHAPGECQFCDLHPEWQELRNLWDINFTGHHDEKKMMCPAERRRPVENLHLWYGNVPTPPDRDHRELIDTITRRETELRALREQLADKIEQGKTTVTIDGVSFEIPPYLMGMEILALAGRNFDWKVYAEDDRTDSLIADDGAVNTVKRIVLPTEYVYPKSGDRFFTMPKMKVVKETEQEKKESKSA